MTRKHPKLVYIGLDLFTGEESVTSDEIFEAEPEHLDTGLLDQFGEPIRRASARVAVGFQIKR